MIRVFADESENNGMFVMGGWVAPIEQWEQLSNAWVNALNQPPAIRYFKHHEAKSKDGEFAGLLEEQINTKLIALAATICSHAPSYGILCQVRSDTLDRVMKSEIGLPRKVLRGIVKTTEPYQFGFIDLVSKVLAIQERCQAKDTVDFIFDEHGLFGSCFDFMRKLRQYLGDSPRGQILGTVSPACDSTTPALQCSDLLVGQYTTALRTGIAEQPLEMLGTGIDVFLSQAFSGQHAARVPQS